MKDKIRIIGIMTGEHVAGKTLIDFTRWGDDFKKRRYETYHATPASTQRAFEAMLKIRGRGQYDKREWTGA